MTVAQSVADVLEDHLTLEMEGIDRMLFDVNYFCRLVTIILAGS